MQEINKEHPIAYLCAEYAIESRLPFYAGGLGVLAGDTIKAAADRDLPFVAIGLLYRGERIIQEIDNEGMQIEKDMNFDPVSSGLEHVYKDDQPLFIKVKMNEYYVWARVWKKTFSKNTILYLLDTDTDQNQLQERSITHGLYIGTEGTTLKQQLLLGVGGVKVLYALGIRPSVYHINEGRPAFVHWELIRKFMDEHGKSYQEAVVLAKSKTVYTNHTLVAAGNNFIRTEHLKVYAKYYANKMGITVEQLLDAGIKENKDHFRMTNYGLNVSKRASGVSQLHTKLSRKLWPNYDWVNVTNGVHFGTWQDHEIAQCDQSSDEVWHLHLEAKKRLKNFVLQRTGFSYPEDRMVITWARRLAGYKRLDSLFADVERLRQILRDANKPVQLLVSGKAHILDKHGKIKLQKIIRHMARELSGYAIFIPNYDLDVAKHLVSGSDLWINIPEYGKEACGTSGMKAIANGVLKCTVADGWAEEVNWDGIGWILDNANVSNDLYTKLEQEIIPLYYQRDHNDIPQEWLERMQKSIELSYRFSAKRMLDEYLEKLYK